MLKLHFCACFQSSLSAKWAHHTKRIVLSSRWKSCSVLLVQKLQYFHIENMHKCHTLNKYEGSLQTFLPSEDCERPKCTKFLVFARRKLGTNGTIASQGMKIQGHLPHETQTLYKTRQNYLREKESLWRPLVSLTNPAKTCKHKVKTPPEILYSVVVDTPQRKVPFAPLPVN